MVPGEWIESVYSLTTLPTPLDAENGRISASTVTSITESRKRKRPEIAAAIDGEGINIYSIENSHLIASYAVSPDTYFDTAPCSVYLRHNKQNPPQRIAYATSRSSKSSKTVRLHCYEDGPQNLSYSASKSGSSTLPSSTQVKLIDIFPLPQITDSDTQSHQVIVLQQDGTLSCFSEKLEKSLWSIELNALPAASDGFDLPEAFQIDHAEITTLLAAKQGFLKGRQDTLAAFGSDEDPILVILGSSASLRFHDALDVDLHVYSLPRKTSKDLQSSHHVPHQMLSWSLPQPSRRKNTTASEYAFTSSAGLLTELSDGVIKTYDLSTLTPRLADSFASKTEHDAVVRLSPSLLLTASSSTYAIYDSKYGSLLASHSIPISTSTPSKKQISKQTEDSQISTTFVGYFAKSGIAVAVRDSELVAIQIGAEARSMRRRKTGTLLIDSVGKGLLASSTAYTLDNRPRLPSKRKRKQQADRGLLFTSPELDTLIEQSEIETFDRQFAGAVYIDVNHNAANGSEVLFPGEESVSHTRWAFPHTDKLHSYPPCRPQALYVLSRIFELNSTAKEREQFDRNSGILSIRMKFYPENVFMWLVHTGQLRADLVQQALAEFSGSDQHVPHGDVVRALTDFDPSLALVHYMLKHHPHIDIDELVIAVKVTVNSLDDSSLPQPEQKVLLDEEFANAATTAGALTSGVTGLTNGDTLMTNGHSESHEGDDEAEEEADAVMDDVDEMMDQAYETLDKGLPIRGESLRQALTKLNSLSPPSITHRLRATLTHHELVFLIHILRVELENGGWTSRYEHAVDSDNAENHEEPSNRAITVISNMLSCTVDALGMSGWVMASASDPFDSIDETLNLLRAEISATLEGVHEATFTYGVLSDFLRHHYKRQKSAVKDKEMEIEEKWKQGKTVVVEKEPTAYLPVGLGVDKVVEPVRKMMYGGKKRKRLGEIGKEKRRGLPQYVFERIRF